MVLVVVRWLSSSIMIICFHTLTVLKIDLRLKKDLSRMKIFLLQFESCKCIHKN